jgi:hypothetical protein
MIATVSKLSFAPVLLLMLTATATAPVAAAESPRKLLDDIRAAMAARDLPGAKSKLDEAAALKTPEDVVVEVERLHLLYDYLVEFWHAVDDGGKSLRGGDELVFGDARVAVVEYGQGRIVVRAVGQNRRYTLKTMPTKLVLKLASRTLNPNLAPNKVFLGSYHAVDGEGDRALAKKLWEEAGRAGEDVSRLLPELGVAPVQPAATAPNVQPPALSRSGKAILAADQWNVRRRTATKWVRGPLGELGKNTDEGRLQIEVPDTARGDVQVLFRRKLTANFGCRLMLTGVPPDQAFGLLPDGDADGGHVVPLTEGTVLVEFARYAGKFRARVNGKEVSVESADTSSATMPGYVGFTLAPGKTATVAAFELRGK